MPELLQVRDHITMLIRIARMITGVPWYSSMLKAAIPETLINDGSYIAISNQSAPLTYKTSYIIGNDEKLKKEKFRQ